MKAESLRNIKAELLNIPAKEVLEICLRLAKHKKENKELLSYLLFHNHDDQLFITEVKAQIDEEFSFMNSNSAYLAKKTLRKVLRTINKYIKFAANKQIEVELRLYYCQSLKKSKIKINRHPVIYNLYNRQIDQLEKTLAALHEDLRHDYQKEIVELYETTVNQD
ncbi:MAG: hypothetical protein M0Q90_00805 [Bacteroidales bacterium]|nr:hypothetical protein [Bacteroidales bacterium]